MSNADDLIADLRRDHPRAAELATRVSLPVRVTPAFVRLARVRLLPQAGTGDEADLWLSPLVESRSGAGLSFRREVRARLRESLAADAALLEQVWNEIHATHAPWLSPRARMEEELTWRLLANPEDPAIDALWAEVVRDLDQGSNAEGVARWVTRAMPDLPPGSLLHEHGHRAYHGAHLLLGDASVLGDQPQAFMDSATFAFATRRLPRVSLQVGALENRVLASTSEPIRNGHEIRIPATRPLWLQVDRDRAGNMPPSQWVLRLDPADRVGEVGVDAPFVHGSSTLRLRALDGAAWDLLPADVTAEKAAVPRAPKVDLTYEIELYGALKRIQLPFVMGVIADLGHPQGQSLPAIEERKFLDIDVDNFDERLRALRPALALRVPSPFNDGADMAIRLEFTRLDDFNPSAVAAQVSSYGDWQRVDRGLSTLVDWIDAGEADAESILQLLANKAALTQLRDLPADDDTDAPTSAVTTTTPRWAAVVGPFVKVDPPRADALLGAGFVALARAADAFGPEALAFPDLLRGIADVRERIRQGLNRLLDLIFHQADFRKLEGTWRGLHNLVSRTETGEMNKIKAFNLSKKDLMRSLARSQGPEWDQNVLFKKIYEEEFGQLGGEPYGLLLVDFEFSHQPGDAEALQALARIGAAAHAPVLTNVSPSMLQMDSWRDLESIRDLTKLFTTPEYAAWRHLREQDDSRYLCLTLPRVLARPPWTSDRSGEVDFDESTDGEDDDHFVWMGSAHLMAANIARGFARDRWFVRIVGIDSGGLVNQLHSHGFRRDNASMAELSPTGVVITDRLEAGFAQLGFSALAARRNSDAACFYSARTLYKAPTYEDPAASATAHVSARLPQLLVCSRVMLYLACMLRDRVGSYSANDDIQRYLNEWLMQYIGLDDGDFDRTRAAMRPLASAQVQIMRVEDSTDRFLLSAEIAPRYQFAGEPTTLRLTHPLPLQMSA